MREKLFLCCLLLICSFAIADVSESFDYPAGALTDQDGGSGWTSPWRNNYSRNGGNYVVSDAGLTYETVPGVGNSAFTPGDGSRYQRDLDTMYDDGIVYLSFLMQCIPSTSDDEYTAVELQSGTDADPGRVLQIGVLRKDDGIDPGDGGNEEFYATVRNGIGGSMLNTVKLADLDGEIHYFVVRFDLVNDVAHFFVDPTADTPLGTSGIELQLFEGFSFDRIGLARFVGGNDAFIDEITVDYAGVDNVYPARGDSLIDPEGLVFEWGEPSDPNIASVISYTVYVDPNLLYMENGEVAEFDFVEENITGTQTVSSPAAGLTFDTDYYWRVAATVRYDTNSTREIISPIWSFKTKLQDNPPIVDAGGNFITSLDLASASFVSNAVVTDDGTTPMTTLWEAFEISADDIMTTNVAFDDPAVVNTAITVSTPGTYFLKLTATDGNGSVSDVVEMRVYEDGCRAVKASGTWQANYYDTNSDCVVDVNDFALFAVEWLDSTELSDSVTYSASISEPVDTNEALIADVWVNIDGTDVEELLDAPVFALAPDFSYQITGELRGRPTGSRSGERITGYIVPPATGDYIFYIASDDKSRLFVSSDTTPVDTDPALANHIAEVSDYSAIDEWEKLEGQASEPVSLIAGQYYYIEILHKERQGGNHVSVGWSTDGGTTIEVVPGTALRSSLP